MKEPSANKEPSAHKEPSAQRNPSQQHAPWKIECVLADRGWILERLAKEIAKAAANTADIQVAIVDAPSGNADLTYFLPYSIQANVEDSLVVSYFSHQEMVEPAHTNFITKALDADHCIVSAKKYERVLNEAGANSVSLVYLATDLAAFEPKLKLGVVGRTYHTGRKGEDLVASLMDLPFVEFVFTGEGWPEPPKYFAGEAGMQAFYHEIDYLLIPATIEGGPVPLFEALASGCEVIASDVGCVEDFPHIPFKTGDEQDLRRVLEKLIESKHALRKSVESHDWSDYGAAHVKEFARLLEKSGRPRPINASAQAKEGATKTLDQTAPNALLVMHGSESTSKGGPTTRISAIADHVATQMACNLTYSLEEPLAQQSTANIAHVFNSWPLNSALKELSHAKTIADRVVYSPITLNLAYLPYYAHLIPEFLSYDSEKAEARLQHLVKDTQPLGFESAVKLEGIPKHFSSLFTGAQRADHLIFLSDYEKRMLRGLGVETPGTIIRNGVDAKTMAAADPNLFRQHYGVSDFVLCVGRIETRKNQAALALAARELNTTVVCIGHIGDPAYFEQIKHHAGDNLLHIDRIEDRQMLASAYAAARCKVLCSWAEGAPLSVLEAGSAGTPLIVSTMGAEKEYCDKWATYVHPADISGLRERLKAIIENPESSEQRKLRSDYFCSKFSLETHAQETAALYKLQLAEPPSAQRSKNQWLDITHLAHTLSNNQVVTGVNSLEQEVAAALQSQPDSSIVLWNPPRNAFCSVAKSRWEDGSYPQLANQQELTNPSDDPGYSALEISINASKPAKPIAPINNTGAADARLSPARLSKTLAKTTLAKLPTPVKSRAINQIRKFRKDFDPVVEPQHQLGAGSAASQNEGVAELSDSSTQARVTRRFTSLELHSPELSNTGLIEAGDRFLVLGQPWISNDRYLSQLVKLIDETGASLEAMVPDILYVTRTLSFDESTRQIYRRRLELLLSRCNRVYTISQQAAREIRDFVNLLRLQIEVLVIPMGLPQMTKTTTPCKPLKDKKYLMYVSSLNARKNHEFLLSAWADVRKQLSPTQRAEWRLALIGNPQKGFERFSEPEKMQQLERDQGVLLLTGVGDAELGWIYENCAFTVYPSASEGWGFPVQESLYAGKVCVVSDTVPAAEETPNAALRKLAPDDFMGWVRTIRMLVQNEKQRLALQTHADAWEPQSWDAAVRTIRSTNVR